MTRPGGIFLAALIAAGGLAGGSPAICALPGVLVAGRQEAPPSREQIDAHIDRLGAFDVDARLEASQALRRARGTIVLPALLDAAMGHADGFVRARALVLLAGYDDPRVADQMEQMLTEPNERLRMLAYQYFERHPEPRLASPLIKALGGESGELARPALIGALAALGADPKVQRALVSELSRAGGAARTALIAALGRHAAAYATKPLADIALVVGPHQPDAVLALARTGDKQSLALLGSLRKDPAVDVRPALDAAFCMLGEDCDAGRRSLVQALTSRQRLVGFERVVRSAAEGLAALFDAGDAAAGVALLDAGLAGDDPVRTPVATALAAVAARRPAAILTLLGEYPDRSRALELIRDGFDARAEDLEREHFFAAVRSTYFAEPQTSARREVAQAIINELEL